MNLKWTPNANKSYEHIMTCATDFYGKALLRKLVYTIFDDVIYIADIWDTRQSPEKLKDRIL